MKTGDKLRVVCADVYTPFKQGEIVEYAGDTNYGVGQPCIDVRLSDGVLSKGWLASRFEEMSSLDLKKPLKTQDGRDVKIYEQLPTGKIVGLIFSGGAPCVYEWGPNGEPANYPGNALVNVPPPPVSAERWILLYKDGKTYMQDRIPGEGCKALAIKKITIIEGEGLHA